MFKMNDDLIYLILLITGIIIGPFIHSIQNVAMRKAISAMAGFAIACFASGWDVLHPITLILVNSFIVLFSGKRVCHILSFLFCFTYITLVRIGYYFGMPYPPIYGSAIQMYLTLKMIGLAFEVHDAHVQQTDASQSLKTRMLSIQPILSDIICYGFCHAGILTGPYFKFQTYIDSFHHPTSNFKDAQTLSHLGSRMKFVPLYITVFSVLKYLYPAQSAVSEEILQSSFWYRVWYSLPVAYAYHMRLVSLFILSEGQCITMAIGKYNEKCLARPGQGPTILEYLNDKKGYEDETEPSRVQTYDYQTIRSVNVEKCELAITGNEYAANWNMTVQYWLYWYFYRRLPIHKSYRSIATAFLSAIWHGIEPAYFVWATTVIFLFFTQNIMSNAHRKTANRINQTVFNLINWMLCFIMCLYGLMPFILVDFYSFFTYYKSVHFYGHFFMTLANIICINIHVKSA